jgi:hypothetical protein
MRASSHYSLIETRFTSYVVGINVTIFFGQIKNFSTELDYILWVVYFKILSKFYYIIYLSHRKLHTL